LAALFEVDGDRYVPTEATPGPWGDHLMHGGALGALCVHAMEAIGAADAVAVRFNGVFVRPLLRGPLTVDASVTRSGKRLELVEGVVRSGDVEIARCSLLGIRPLAVELPASATTPDTPPPDQPEDFEPPEMAMEDRVVFYGTGIEMRSPAGFQAGVAWFRLLRDVVPGAAGSPMARAVAAADFGLGISSPGEWPPRLSYPNADLVVHCARPVAGEWVRIASESTWTADGIGLCTMTIADRTGTIGTGAQSQVLTPAG
jgi:acyl-Coa thioesterase superfamily protein/acyl-CoA thioesterase superfamily protein